MSRGLNPYDEARIQKRLWTPAILRPDIWVDPNDGTITPTSLINKGTAFSSASATAAHYALETIQGRKLLRRTSIGTCFISNSNYCPYKSRFSVYGFGLVTSTLFPGIFFGGTTTTGFLSYDMLNTTWDLYHLNNGTDWYGIGNTTFVTGNDGGVPLLMWNRRTSDTSVQIGAWAQNFTAITGTMTISNTVPVGTTTVGIYGRGPFIAPSSAGLYGEVLAFERDIGEGNELKVQGYIAWNANSAHILPASHPFRNCPPLIGD